METPYFHQYLKSHFDLDNGEVEIGFVKMNELILEIHLLIEQEKYQWNNKSEIKG